MQVIWIQDVFMISSFMFVQSLSFVIFLNTLFLSYASGWKCYSCLSCSLHSDSKLCWSLGMLLMLINKICWYVDAYCCWLDAYWCDMLGFRNCETFNNYSPLTIPRITACRHRATPQIKWVSPLASPSKSTVAIHPHAKPLAGSQSSLPPSSGRSYSHDLKLLRIITLRSSSFCNKILF
jgi:hypothetical protein